MICIYILINPMDGQVFYVGATAWPETRLQEHIAEGKRKDKTEKQRLIRSIIENGYEVEMEVVEECRYYFTTFWEKFYINLFSSWGYNLLQNGKSGYDVFSFCRRYCRDSNLSSNDKQVHFQMAMDFYNKCENSEPVCVSEF